MLIGNGVITITQAQFRTNKTEWRVAGNTTVLGDSMNIYLNDPPVVANPVCLRSENCIGGAVADALGNWRLRIRGDTSVPIPAPGDFVTVVSNSNSAPPVAATVLVR